MKLRIYIRFPVEACGISVEGLSFGAYVFRVKGLGFRVEGSGSTVQGVGCKIQSLAFRG